jgi:hypothetical protein
VAIIPTYRLRRPIGSLPAASSVDTGIIPCARRGRSGNGLAPYRAHRREEKTGRAQRYSSNIGSFDRFGPRNANGVAPSQFDATRSGKNQLTGHSIVRAPLYGRTPVLTKARQQRVARAVTRRPLYSAPRGVEASSTRSLMPTDSARPSVPILSPRLRWLRQTAPALKNLAPARTHVGRSSPKPRSPESPRHRSTKMQSPAPCRRQSPRKPRQLCPPTQGK